MTGEKISMRALIIGALSFVAITAGITLLIQAVGIERLRELIERGGATGALVYIAARAVTNIAAPLNGGALQFAAGAAFSFPEALLYSLIGEAIGGSVNFWIARRWGRPVVARFVGGADGMTQVERFYRQFGSPVTLIFARIFLFPAYDFISYAVGLTRIKYWHYLVITVVVGVIPTTLGVWIGSMLTGGVEQLIPLYIALGVIAVASFVVYGRVRRWLRLDDAPVPAGD
jgi:uncharacterized membrane protein YdjX (TVP38/TMEM64 family)